jgi:hypothetical protein
MRPSAHQRLNAQRVCDINMSGRVESRRRMVLVEEAPQFRLMLCNTVQRRIHDEFVLAHVNHPDLWGAFFSLGIWPRAEDSRFLERNLTLGG